MQLSSQQICACYTVEVLDGDAVVHESRTCGARSYWYGEGHGWDNLLARRHAAQHNLLAGDRLRLRVTVTLEP